MTPVFLTYINRSGSTFLVNQLSKHPYVCIIPEADILVEKLLKHPGQIFTLPHYFRLIKLLKKDYKYRLWNYHPILPRKITGLTHFEIFQYICNEYAGKECPGSSIFIFKSTLLQHYYDRIEPVCQVRKIRHHWLALVRDPRAIYFSQQKTISPHTGKRMSQNIAAFCYEWNSFIRKMNMINNNELTLVRYEDLIRDNKNSLRKISNRLDIPEFNPDTARGKVYDMLPEEYKSIHRDIGEKPIIEYIDKWKTGLSAFYVKCIESGTKKNLITSGYRFNENKARISPFTFLFIHLKYLIIFFFNRIKRFIKQCINGITGLRIYFIHLIAKNTLFYKNYCFIRGQISRIFNDIQSFCLFIGYPRSGHTLVAAMLDAHPNMAISIEANVLSLISRKWKRKQIFYYLLRRTKFFASTLNYIWKGYKYEIPGQYQGKWTSIKIIGDKKAGKTTEYLTHHPEFLDNLKNTVNVPLKIILVIRNPYDNVATMAIRSKNNSAQPSIILDKYIRSYFDLAMTNLSVIRSDRYDLCTVYFEEFLENPKKELIRILDFLKMNYKNDYLEDCISIINSPEHKSRYEVKWSDKNRKDMHSGIQQIDFLNRYINTF
jgi:hypothetical protein